MMFGGTLRIEVICSGRLTLYGSEMWTPAQRSARLPPPARIADRPARGVPGSEFVLPRAPASGSGSPSVAPTDSFSKLSGISGLGWGLLGASNPSGSVEETEVGSSSHLQGTWILQGCSGPGNGTGQKAPCLLEPESQDSLAGTKASILWPP